MNLVIYFSIGVVLWLLYMIMNRKHPDVSALSMLKAGWVIPFWPVAVIGFIFIAIVYG